MTAGIVNSETVEHSQLLVPKSNLVKPYVFPFLIIYPIYIKLYNDYYDEYFVGREWTFIYTLSLVSLHALIWLLPNWNLDLKVKFQYDKVASLNAATHILVKAKPSFGLSEISKIEKSPEQISFKYQKRKFLWNPTSKTFSPPAYFVDNENLTINQLKNFRGLISEKVPSLEKHYGLNFFDIPVPTFIELFVEHMLAPFFVFQLFSISLWLMDEMWYLSLFSLFMLFSFEATTVYQRKSTMTEFQSMGIKPYDIWVYRDKNWKQIQTDHLLPGDIVSVIRTPHEDLSIPCDMLLLQGSCIVNEAMLSGESTPLLKESIENRESNSKYQPETLDKNSLLHGGTSCLQVTVPEKPALPLAPDNGALAIVTKTGFETTQGSLVRVMIFSSERMSVANKEAFFFILFLLIFAIIASRYVWVEGTKMGRKQSKLILDCIIVLTSVVPPELPMELTMAVNQSLAALAKHYIYCTEPFRIPVAGRIDVCCFDKTGTLTAEDLFFEGLAGLNPNDQTVLSKCDAPEVPSVTRDLLGSVHALVRLDDGEVVGDPMEKETVKVSGWKLDDKAKNVMVGPNNKSLQILKRFQFSSSLKRSSVISKTNDRKILIGCKGAPETIADRLSVIPEGYESTYKYFTRNGSRVLALAYKFLDNEKAIEKLERKDVESNLKFAGFIVFHCPMKSDAVETIQMLNQSSHRCVMITGDNPLTACHVAREVGIITKDVLILDRPEKNHAGDSSLEWRNVDETRVIPVNKGITFDLKFLQENDLCVTGYALSELSEHPQISTLIRHTWIYSRVSPSQKEFILNTYKNLGYNTLMCGDGTNDVGALKAANIGIALLNGTEESLKQMQENKKIENFEKMYAKQCELMAKWNQPKPKVPVQIAHLHPPGPKNPHYLKALEQHGTVITPEIRLLVEEANRNAVIETDTGSNNAGDNVTSSLLSQLQESQEDEEAPVLKLGDASVAAPFTSKLANVTTVVNVIRQGRCALVSTIQMYKILALNCLISAYSLSVLYLAGIKFGDAQATVSGILLSVCFMSISRGKSLDKLSKERPQPGIFNIYIMGSILGQFAIHLIALIYITKEIYILEPREPQIDLDKTFQPSLLNTAMFLLQLSQQISTFTVNYIGRPFRESIHENKGMYYGILGVAFLCISGATEFMPELNEAMKFVPMTDLFKFKLTVTMLLDFFVAWGIELALKYYFMDFKAADIADRTYDDDSSFTSDQEKKDQ